MLYQSPRTSEEWWANVNTYWDDLYGILYRFLPMDGDIDYNGRLLAETMEAKVCRLKEQQVQELVRYFHSAWHSAPDSAIIHKIPSWGVLCDLCSEDYVLYEDRENITLL